MESVRDLWRYRELFYFLAWRDVKVEYNGRRLELHGPSFSRF